MKDTCTKASGKGATNADGAAAPDDWSKMCDALESFDCSSPSVSDDAIDFADCCTKQCDKTKLSPDQQADCCATCIGDSQKTTTNAPAPTDAPAPNPGPTPSPSSPSES